jgi:hypothetical protein
MVHCLGIIEWGDHDDLPGEAYTGGKQDLEEAVGSDKGRGIQDGDDNGNGAQRITDSRNWNVTGMCKFQPKSRGLLMYVAPLTSRNNEVNCPFYVKE